jgi:hypothetical protein
MENKQRDIKIRPFIARYQEARTLPDNPAIIGGRGASLRARRLNAALAATGSGLRKMRKSMHHVASISGGSDIGVWLLKSRGSCENTEHQAEIKESLAT